MIHTATPSKQPSTELQASPMVWQPTSPVLQVSHTLARTASATGWMFVVQGFQLFDNATTALLTNCETVEQLLSAYANGQLPSPLVNDLYRTATYMDAVRAALQQGVKVPAASAQSLGPGCRLSSAPTLEDSAALLVQDLGAWVRQCSEGIVNQAVATLQGMELPWQRYSAQLNDTLATDKGQTFDLCGAVS